MKLIYALFNENNDVFYIGATHDLKRRMREHKFSGKHLILNAPSKMWREREHYWIERYRSDGAPLINKTIGRNGVESLSEEARRRLSLTQRGKAKPPGTGAKISAKTKGKPHQWSVDGKSRALAALAAGRATVANDPVKAEARRRHADWMRSIVDKEKHAATSSANGKKRWASYTPERRAELGRKHSEALRNSERAKAAAKNSNVSGMHSWFARLSDEERRAFIDRREKKRIEAVRAVKAARGAV